MKYTVLIAVVGLVFACSDTKKSSKEEAAAAKATRTAGVKIGLRGPLSDEEKKNLKDCGKGALLDSESSITSLDSRCEAHSIVQIVMSEKYRVINDSILFDGAIWVLVETKERDPAVVRLGGSLEESGTLDDGTLISLDIEDEILSVRQQDRLVIERGKLWVTGGFDGRSTWLNVTEKGAGEHVRGPGPVDRPFRVGEQLWTANDSSGMPSKEGLDYPYPEDDLWKLYTKTYFEDAHGENGSMFLSLVRKKSKVPQLIEFDGETVTIKRTIDLPLLLNKIVVAHGYIWGISEAERKLVRVPVTGGEMEPLMTLIKPGDHFYADIAADATSVWLSYQGEPFDSGVIRFSIDGKPTGFIGHLSENVRVFYPHGGDW